MVHSKKIMYDYIIMSQSKNFISVFPLTFFSDKIEIDNNYKKKLVSLILDDEKKSTRKKPNDS